MSIKTFPASFCYIQVIHAAFGTECSLQTRFMQITLLCAPTAIKMPQKTSNSTSVGSSNSFVVAVETH